MNAFTIKDLENLSGIKAHTIRIWEQRYTLFKPQRTLTNIRHYTNEDLKLMLNISLLNKYGFKISAINKLSIAEMREKILQLQTETSSNDLILNELIGFLLDVNNEEFENVLENYIKVNGLENCIIGLIFPFLEKVGILWITNHINPTQEHLATNIIRQKLIAAIDNIKIKVTKDSTFLLFLPDGEFHEIGLLFVHFLLKKRFFNVLYLGANVPMKHIGAFINFKNPNFIYTHVTASTNVNSTKKMLDTLHSIEPKKQIIVTGQITKSYKNVLPSNIIFKNSLSTFIEFIDTL
jgi:MerR family transcriptional regulator, light-induced transcriptional regulator